MLAARALGAAATLAFLAACASPTPGKAEAFVTRDRRVVIEPAVLPAGEIILDIENDDDEPHHVVVIRLLGAATVAGLPLVDGRLPVGSRADLDFRGEGYEVVAKLDRMKAYFQGPNRIRDLVHDY